MLAVDTALADLRLRCQKRWLHWLLGEDTWPLKIKLGSPSGDEFAAEPIAAQNWAATWHTALAEHRLPGSVHTVTRQPRKLRLGRFDLPHSWIIAGPEEALTVAPDIAQRYRTTAARLNFAVEHPGVIWDRISQIPQPAAKTIAAFDDADWSSAIAVVSHLAAGPIEATMVRQLAIPGVHTKWIEQNPSLVCAMIGVPADRSLGDPLTRLINHIGLKAKETPVHVALPCPRLRASAANFQRLQAPISVLNASTIRPDVVLIIENDEPGHTLTADIPGAAIIHGLGFGAPILADLHWIASASTVLYWGDIDRAGLSILASLRRAGVAATALLMDGATLDKYTQFRHNTDTQTTSLEIPDGLNPSETALYQRLNAHHQANGSDLQLEQEHIPIGDVLQTIRDVIGEEFHPEAASFAQSCRRPRAGASTA